MKSIETIVEDYRDSDSEERLYMFLDSPSLRNYFINIELSEASAEPRGRKRDGIGSKRTGFRTVFMALKQVCTPAGAGKNI